MHPARCFCAEDLYSMRFGTHVTDVVERTLFGRVDNRGALAAAFFDGYDVGREGRMKRIRRFLLT